MAKIQRYEGNLQAFASAATGQERVVFGNDDNPPIQSDDLTANINSNFARGWGVLPLGNKPPREWFNSVAFAATQLSAYQHQMGVPEWDDEQEYHDGSIANVGGVLFSSLQDNNIGNPVSDLSWWRPQLSAVVSTETYLIPSDYATIQDAINSLSAYKMTGQGSIIDLVIESGHQPSSGLVVTNGDYSNFRISAQDAEVNLSASYPLGEYFIDADRANAPTLNCLINGNGSGGGLKINNVSTAYVTPGSGVKNTWLTGLAVGYGSYAYASNSIFTGCAQNGTTGSGIQCWAGNLIAEECDVSNSGYYGAQASHGGVLSFRFGVANNTGRYGVRATDAGIVDFDGGTSNDNVVYGIYAFNCSRINARSATATGNGTANIACSQRSDVLASDGVYTGSLGSACIVDGSSVNLSAADLSGAADNGILAIGSEVSAAAADVSGAGNHGIYARNNSKVNFRDGVGNNCSSRGVYADGASSVDAVNASLNDCGSAAVWALNCSVVNLPGGSAQRGGTNGVYAFSGGKVNVKNVNCRTVDGVDNSVDIRCIEGSEIIAHSATGGLSKAANALTGEGIIYQ